MGDLEFGVSGGAIFIVNLFRSIFLAKNIILFKNRFNSFIYFSASDWYNKIPISLFQTSKS